MSPLDDLKRTQALIASWKNNVHTHRADLAEAKRTMEKYVGKNIRVSSGSGVGAEGELREVIPDVAGLRLRFPGTFSYQPFVHRIVNFEVL